VAQTTLQIQRDGRKKRIATPQKPMSIAAVPSHGPLDTGMPPCLWIGIAKPPYQRPRRDDVVTSRPDMPRDHNAHGNIHKNRFSSVYKASALQIKTFPPMPKAVGQHRDGKCVHQDGDTRCLRLQQQYQIAPDCATPQRIADTSAKTTQDPKAHKQQAKSNQGSWSWSLWIVWQLKHIGVLRNC